MTYVYTIFGVAALCIGGAFLFEWIEQILQKRRAGK